jgi:hypothetical protein
MSKKYRLKPYDKVSKHHYISEKRWNALAECEELEVEFLDGILGKSALVYPKGKSRTFTNVFMVSEDDLYVVNEKPPVLKDIVKNTIEEVKKKTYTKDEIRNEAMRLMTDEDLDEESAVISALTLAKLIGKLK